MPLAGIFSALMSAACDNQSVVRCLSPLVTLCSVKLNGTYVSIVISVAVCALPRCWSTANHVQILDGIGRTLDPELDLLKRAIPVLARAWTTL